MEAKGAYYQLYTCQYREEQTCSMMEYSAKSEDSARQGEAALVYCFLSA